MKKSIAIVLFLAAGVYAAGVRFDNPRGLDGGLPASEMKWHALNGSSEEEHNFMIAFFDNGMRTFTTFFTFKYGPFKKSGFYTLFQEDGRENTIFVKGECPDGKTALSGKDYGFTCGDTSYTTSGKDYTLKVRDPLMNADIKFTSIVPPFSPGRTIFTPDGLTFSECTVYAPRAKTEGSITIAGKTITTRGDGYSDHTYQNYPFTKQGAVYYAVRAFPDSKTPAADQIFLNFSYQELHKSWGGAHDTFMFVVKNDKILGVTRKLVVEPLEHFTDPNTGYKYVKKVSLKVDDPAISFSGVFMVTKTIEVMDIFQWIPAAARKIASSLFKRPVYFRFIGSLDGQLKVNGQSIPIRQRATSEMNFTQ